MAVVDEQANENSPLYALLNQINHAAKTGLDLIAIGMAVALPDICVSLSSADGRSDGQRYVAWCRENLSGPEFSYITGEDFYSIRCGVLHNGRFGDLKHNVSRIGFVPAAGSQGNTFEAIKAGDAYMYSVVEFCKNICDAAFRWFERSREDPIVVSNAPRLMQYYPHGLSPFARGMTVIA